MPAQQKQQPHLIRSLLLLALLGSGSAHAADTGDLWEVSMKMTMAGMPMAMPAQTTQVCQPKGEFKDEKIVENDGNCKLQDLQRNGNKSHFKVVCSGRDAMTGVGDFEHNADNYKGTMRMTGKMEGETFDMTQNIAARRIGGCAYKDPGAIGKEMVAKQEAITAATCRNSIDKLEWALYKDDAVPACKPYRKEFCDRVGSTATGMRSAAGFRAVAEKRKDWELLLGTCAVDSKPVLAAACQDGLGRKDGNFLAEYCPAEAKQVAQEQCAGRDYTAVMSGPYAALCRSYGADQLRAGSQQQKPAGTTTEDVKNTLKKLLPF